MAEDVDVPKVGKVDKRVVVGVVGAGAAFVAYRYWAASRSGTSDEEVASSTNAEFDESGDPAAVLGAVRPNNDYGLPEGSPAEAPSTDDFGFRGTTNDAWTQYAANQLSQSDRWSYTDVVEALGNFLAQRPTTAIQQNIVNAAIAVAGQPPVGSHTLVSGGNTPLTVAPTITGITTTGTTATISFTAVAGATSYYAYRGGSSPVGARNVSPITVTGLTPNTSYTFTVKGVTAAGTTGPASAGKEVRTKSVTLAVPKTPSVSNIGKTTATFTTGSVTGATGYNWFINGKIVGHSDTPRWAAKGLRSQTTYHVTVQADNSTQPATKQSAAKTFTTK